MIPLRQLKYSDLKIGLRVQLQSTALSYANIKSGSWDTVTSIGPYSGFDEGSFLITSCSNFDGPKNCYTSYWNIIDIDQFWK